MVTGNGPGRRRRGRRRAGGTGWIAAVMSGWLLAFMVCSFDVGVGSHAGVPATGWGSWRTGDVVARGGSAWVAAPGPVKAGRASVGVRRPGAGAVPGTRGAWQATRGGAVACAPRAPQ